MDQLVTEAYQHLEVQELDGLAGRVTEVLRTGKPRAEPAGKVRPLYEKGNHLRPGNWRPIGSAVTEAKLVWMVISGRIQRRLYAARVIPDNMKGSVLGSSTQEASFLYDMYLDDEDLEAFMASVAVKGAFPNTPHRLIEEVWQHLGVPYGDFVGKYLRSRRYTVATGKGCTEWVTPGSGVEGPFLYMLAMLPLMSWIAREYPQLARAPHSSPAPAYVDDTVPMARDEKVQQVVQDLMQRYGSDKHLVWSAEKSAVLRRGGEGGMALDGGDGVALLERPEEALPLGHVQAMEEGGLRLSEKMLRGFRAMLVVLRHHPPSVQMTLYYLRAVLNAVIGYQGMHLPYWNTVLEEVEGEVRRLIRGDEGIPTEVQMGWDTVQGLQEEDEGVAVSFQMTDTGRPEEEAPIVPVGHKSGESARRIRLTVHGLPADRVWYLVLVQANLEHSRAKGDRAWCLGVVVTKSWKARTDHKWAVYRGVRELSIVREYGIGRHRVYCHYRREVVHMPEPTEDRVVIFADGSGVEGQPPKAGAAAVRVKGLLRPLKLHGQNHTQCTQFGRCKKKVFHRLSFLKTEY